MNTPKITIIGAGISGLIAAKVLEKQGFSPTILEATNAVGGRVQTNVIQGYQIDHGFQVLLKGYPYAKKYLDYVKLELQPFLPGATIYKNGHKSTIGDPSRAASLALPTLFANVGSISDKRKVLKLNKELKNKTLQQIFISKEITTLQFLKDFGFSDKMIQQFFKPFFSGIFLEPNLETSCRMFQFVYKMFGEGLATLPKAGIGAITKQLKESLTKTSFNFNTSVASVKDRIITFENGLEIESDYTIVAAPTGEFKGEIAHAFDWKSCDTLYFEVKGKSSKKPLIGLIPGDDVLINNIFFHDSIAMEQKGAHSLLSVTIVKDHGWNEEELISKVGAELLRHCNITVGTMIHRHRIQKALPKIRTVINELSLKDIMVNPTTYLAGDYLLNSSLNAAMYSGEFAAKAVIAAIHKTNSKTNSI